LTIFLIFFKYAGPLLLIFHKLLEHRLKYVFKDGRTNDHKTARKVALVVVIVAGIAGIISMAAADYYIANDKKAMTQANKNLTMTLGAMTQKVEDLRIRQKLLDEKQDKILSAQAQNPSNLPAVISAIIESKREAAVLSSDVYDLENWSDEYHRKIEIALLKKEKAKKEEEQHAQELAKQTEQRNAEAERHISEETSPIFNYAISTLQTKIAARENMTREKAIADMPTVIPNFGPVGHINLGGESPWEFQINITKSPRTLVVECTGKSTVDWQKEFGQSGEVGKPDYVPFDRGRLRGAVYNAESKGWLEPNLGLAYKITLIIAPDLESRTIHTTQKTSRRMADGPPVIEDDETFEHYRKCIDSSLRTLIAAQMEEIQKLGK
jgi:hypothetical protein